MVKYIHDDRFLTFQLICVRACDNETCFLWISIASYQHAQPPWLLRGSVSFRSVPLWLADGLASPLGLSFIFSQMTSTSLSKTCFTLMLSLALASKNWKPGESRERKKGYFWLLSEVWFVCSCWAFDACLCVCVYWPSSVASLWASSVGTCLSSSRSSLLPTSATWALPHEYVLIWVALGKTNRTFLPNRNGSINEQFVTLTYATEKNLYYNNILFILTVLLLALN